MRPIKFQKMNDESVLIKWDDDAEFTLSTKYLRDRCPCAACTGESILWREYKPSSLQILTPGKYGLKSAEVVGNYAIGLTWDDGHNTGLYAFDYLKRICEEQKNLAGS
ncbi:MAG: gamma-butyrobetaine hydroxylase-like domain-containing protein [Candidatus Kryptoniota bacterium]